MTNAKDDTLSVVDVAQQKIVGEFKTGKLPNGLRMSPGGREIYEANTGDDGVSVIDVTGAKEVVRIPVGKIPTQVGFTPDGRRVCVGNEGTRENPDNRASVIDTATNHCHSGD